MVKFFVVLLVSLLAFTWIAKNIPKLGMLFGGMLVLSPLWFLMLGAFDSKYYRSDGSAAGLVIGLIVIGVLIILIKFGIFLIQTARDSE